VAGQRILVVANETCAGRALLDELRTRVSPVHEEMVVAPALNTLRHLFADTDKATAAAETPGGSLRALRTPASMPAAPSATATRYGDRGRPVRVRRDPDRHLDASRIARTLEKRVVVRATSASRRRSRTLWSTSPPARGVTTADYIAWYSGLAAALRRRQSSALAVSHRWTQLDGVSLSATAGPAGRPRS
jgi:hypothetical protein